MKKVYQVFVSSTYEDLKKERNEVITALLEQDCIPIGMEYFPAADASQWSYIKKLIKESDYYILIIAGRYGSELPSGISYTEREYNFAIDNKIPVISFIHKNIKKLPLKHIDTNPEKVKKLNLFLETVEKKLFKKWRDKSELGGAVSRSLIKLKDDTPRTGWVKGGGVEAKDYNRLAFDYTGLIRKHKKLKKKSSTIPKFYEDYDDAFPSIKKILQKSITKAHRHKILRIRVLGICFHKSFPLIKKFIEENAGTGRRIEVRLSKLHMNASVIKGMNDAWDNHFAIFQDQLEELKQKIKKIKNANVSLKISKYEHMPNWHGILINEEHLFLGACTWNKDMRMTAGENHYIHYKKDVDLLHDKKIVQFIRWFDYGRFNGAVKPNKQLIFDTKK